MDATEWDARYASTDLIWGAAPNRFVAAEMSSLAPGSALDVACGEGRNAIWLATRGWRVVGLDFSAVAVERARRLADAAGVADRTEFAVADAVAGPLPRGRFDAVIVAYLQLPAHERRAALRKAAAAVTPGGRLVIVGHHSENLAHGTGGPQDPIVLFTPEDVIADLAGLPGLVVEKAQAVHRAVISADGERSAIDALVVVSRTVTSAQAQA